MCRKLICLVSFVLVLGLVLTSGANAADANLVGCWMLDEGSGNVAYDSSGAGNHGTINGATWVEEGKINSALLFDRGDFVEVPHSESLSITKEITVMAWSNCTDISENPTVVGKGSGAPTVHFELSLQGGGGFWQFKYTDAWVECIMTPGPTLGEWHHIAGTFDGETGTFKCYLDGELGGELESSREDLPENDLPVTIGKRINPEGRFMKGMIDDVRIYNQALTEVEIQEAMIGIPPIPPGPASNPSPANEATDVLRDDVILNWSPGKFAYKHDVYFGTIFDDVNTAYMANSLDVLVSQGQDANSYDAGILDFGQSYYWRADEVNGAPDNTVFKGQVWSFTAEPYSIPVETITVTASSSNADNMGPENTINGVGLDELDQHSTEATEMWLSGMGDPTPSIQYEFDKAYKLNELLVWNSNQVIEAFLGLGAKDVVIESSLDGVAWMILEGATQFAQAPGAADYTANTIVDFGGALAQYVKITINGGHGMLPQYGISAVRFLYIPTFARDPQPADGDITEGADVLLSWRAGREAASHQVYLGTDAENLQQVDAAVKNSFDARALNYDTTYYWQIVEINEAETPSTYTGPVWSITTPAYGTVDSFDQYDDKCKRIFFAWEDGLGHNGGEDVEDCDVAASNGNGGGSIVGNSVAPFAEKTIVSAGSQSLPLAYDNAFGASEATLALDGQDWTAGGIKSLSLQVFGATENSGQLYLKINDAKIDNGAPDISQPGWQPWIIDLSSVGGNLQDVTTLSIGIGGANAAGLVYIDEIRLYP
jgi:hypothetical protein